MSKQTSLKICNDHLNYLVHLQKRQNDPSITKTLNSVIKDHIQEDEEWQHLKYLRSLRNEQSY